MAKRKKVIYCVIVIFIFGVFVFTGCKSSRIVSASELRLKKDFCISPVEYKLTGNSGVMINTDSLLYSDTLMNYYFSRQDIIVANSLTTLVILQKSLRYAGDSSLSGQLYFHKYNDHVQRNIQLMRITIDAFSAEIDCEITRTREVAAYLTNMGKRGNAMLTTAAITAGAITTLAPVWISNTSLQNSIVVSGGLISVVLAVLTLHPGGKKVKLIHERNLLSDIWFQNKTSAIYPAGLWYILSEKQLSNTPPTSKIQVVKTRWLKFYLSNKVDSGLENLLFKNGGIYNVNNLELRASMLAELKSAVNSINQNLAHFVLNLNNFLLAKDLLLINEKLH